MDSVKKPRKRVIKHGTRLRVIINGVMLHGVTPKQLYQLLGVPSQRNAVDFAVETFNRSDVAITGLLTRYATLSGTPVDIQIDLQ